METCRLHGVDPPTWLADVLPRIATTRPSDYADLLPRRWAELRKIAQRRELKAASGPSAAGTRGRGRVGVHGCGDDDREPGHSRDVSAGPRGGWGARRREFSPADRYGDRETCAGSVDHGADAVGARLEGRGPLGPTRIRDLEPVVLQGPTVREDQPCRAPIGRDPGTDDADVHEEPSPPLPGASRSKPCS
ncbi:MAG: transposase domain-containing protein [Myxococcales bacterium]|nr:transposase domain-containing protein [Myxococcales bacterium]